MQRYHLVVFAFVIFILGTKNSHAQAPTIQAYSLTEDPAIPIMGPVVVKIQRDGSKETIEQIMPPGPGRDKEFHSHLLYDFQAHKLYTKILSDPAAGCGVQDYVDPAVPAMLDPITGSPDLLKELTADGQSTEVGLETVNGIATKVMEVTSQKNKGKIWLAQTGGFLVKAVVIQPDGRAQTLIEVKQLSLSKPPASSFAIPDGCLAAQAQMQEPIKPSTTVTALTLHAVPPYKGACPARITLEGTITTNGPGKVFYQFGAGKFDPGEIVTFDAAGTKTVTHAMTFQPTYGNEMGVGAILEAIGADLKGNHETPTLGSNNADFNIVCTSGGGK